MICIGSCDRDNELTSTTKTHELDAGSFNRFQLRSKFNMTVLLRGFLTVDIFFEPTVYNLVNCVTVWCGHHPQSTFMPLTSTTGVRPYITKRPT